MTKSKILLSPETLDERIESLGELEVVIIDEDSLRKAVSKLSDEEFATLKLLATFLFRNHVLDYTVPEISMWLNRKDFRLSRPTVEAALHKIIRTGIVGINTDTKYYSGDEEMHQNNWEANEDIWVYKKKYYDLLSNHAQTII